MPGLKLIYTTLLLMALVLPLVSCSDAPGPEDVAKAAFEATVSADMNTAKPLYCEVMQSIFPSQEEVDAMQKELDINFSFDFSGLTYTLVEQEEDSAKVAVSGTLIVTTPAGEEKLERNDEIPLIKTDKGWLVCE